MGKFYSYSVWLMPNGKANRRLSKIILELSRKYKSPKFKPHVTLIGGFTGEKKDLLSKAERLSKILNSFTVKLTDVSHLNESLRSLFIHAEKTPELINATAIARKVFNLPDDKEHIPHLSLMYGHFSKDIKENIIKKIGKNFDMQFNVKNICLGLNNEREKKWPVIKGFQIKN